MAVNTLKIQRWNRVRVKFCVKVVISSIVDFIVDRIVIIRPKIGYFSNSSGVRLGK